MQPEPYINVIKIRTLIARIVLIICKFCRLYCAALLGTGYVAYNQLKSNKAEMKEILMLKSYMAEPITPVEDLERNLSDMKTQMELLIMRIQAEFCRALELEEDQVRK